MQHCSKRKRKRESEDERGSPRRKGVERGRGRSVGGCGQRQRGPDLSDEIQATFVDHVVVNNDEKVRDWCYWNKHTLFHKC